MANEIAQTVDRALLALMEAAEHGPRSIRDISEELRISMTAARRVVITLHREAMLRRREDGRYEIGPRLLRITEHLLRKFMVMAHPAMRRLAQESGRSVILTGFRADSAEVLHQVDPTQMDLRVDYRSHLSRDLAQDTDGLAILASLNPGRREQLVQEAPTQDLEHRLELIRSAGFVVGSNATWGSLPGLSAPIIDANLGVIGSVTLLGQHLGDTLEGVCRCDPVCGRRDRARLNGDHRATGE